MGSRFSLLTAFLRALLGAGGLIFLVGPLFLPDVFDSSHLSLAGAGLVLGLILHAAFVPGRSSSGGNQPCEEVTLGDRPEWLYDRKWELREAEARDRDLLDWPSFVVLKRNAQGRLTYVNRSFCETFGVTEQEAVGTDFAPTVLEQEDGEPQADRQLPRLRRFTQRLETASGPRWFAWEECASPARDSGGFDVQRVGRDITEERNAVVMLSQAREQAEEESRKKSRFIAALSHEVRRPIERIAGLSDSILSTSRPAERESHAKRIGETARSLLELVEQVVELTEIEAGRPEIGAAAFDLERCVQEAVEKTAHKAHAKGLELGWTLDAGVPRSIFGDETRVRRLLLNLIETAVELTEDGGVLVTAASMPARAERGVVAIRVEASGASLEVDENLRLAMSRKLARVVGGKIVVETGELGHGSAFTLELPLPLDAAPPDVAVPERCDPPVRALICSSLKIEGQALAAELEAAGARVMVVESDDAEGAIAGAANAGEAFDLVFVDVGTSPDVAAVLLACAKDQSRGGQVRGCVLVTARQLDQLEAFQLVGFKDHMVRPVSRSSLRALLGLRERPEEGVAAPSPVPSAVAGGSLPAGARVLIAEDNPINALLTQCMVRRAGFSSQIVETGRAAVDAVRNSIKGKGPLIDLVLLDVHMPDMDGLAAAQELRRLRSEQRDRPPVGPTCPPLIAVTASAFAEDHKACLDAGMDDYLAKPFSWPEFQAMMARWLPRPANAGGVSERTFDAA